MTNPAFLCHRMSDQDTPRAKHRLKPQTVQCILPQMELGAGVEHPDQDVHLCTMALHTRVKKEQKKALWSLEVC